MQRESARIEKARAEFNFRSIEALIPRGFRVLDGGAWSFYLGQLLQAPTSSTLEPRGISASIERKLNSARAFSMRADSLCILFAMTCPKRTTHILSSRSLAA